MEVHPGWREQVDGQEEGAGGGEVLSAVSQSGHESEGSEGEEVVLLRLRDGAPAGDLM